MANQVQIRRETETNLNLVIPADGELAYNITKDRLHVGNGSDAGGIPHSNLYDILNQSFEYVNAGGTANALTAALPYAPLAYTAGLRIKIKATATNTGAATIDVNGLGAKNIFKVAAGAIGNLVAGDIINGVIYELNYDGTQFQLLGSAGGLLTVKQGDLATATGTFSTNNGKDVFVLPGGQYGFTPQLNASSFTRSQAIFLGTSTSYVSAIGLYSSGSTILGAGSVDVISETFNLPMIGYQGGIVFDAVGAQQRYVTSSPPFDLGDGETGGFIYALVNNAGEITSHYAADVPPWAYNGPTNIRCDFQCPKTGKKFRKVREKRSLEEIMDGAAAVYKLEEITMTVKNADMNLIPHPFVDHGPDFTPVLLDPMDERIKRLIDSQNDGDDYIMDAISKGMIKVDNDCMTNRKNPTGCPIHRMKFKYSGGKK